MIEAETGDLLEDARAVGDRVYATRVIDPCMPPPLTRGRNSGGERCPVCKEIVVFHITSDGCIYHRYTNEDKGFKCHHFYCADCWLLYEVDHIGYLDDNGELHSEDDPDYYKWLESTIPPAPDREASSARIRPSMLQPRKKNTKYGEPPGFSFQCPDCGCSMHGGGVWKCFECGAKYSRAELQ